MIHITESVAKSLLITKKIFQNPSACQTYDVVTFEAHDSIPRMDQIMWPRHCVQVFNTQYLNKGAGIGRQRLIQLQIIANIGQFHLKRQLSSLKKPSLTVTLSLFLEWVFQLLESTNQESWGAELHKDLKVHPKARVIHKVAFSHSYKAGFLWLTRWLRHR